MRHKYETEEDLRKEAEVMAVVRRALMRKDDTITDQEFIKLHSFNSVDYVLLQNKRVTYAFECKVRYQHYPQMYIGYKKVCGLRELAYDGVKAGVAFATPKGIYLKRIEPGPLDGWIGVGGRTDRADPQDIEQVVYFGDWVVNGVTMFEEAQPMVRLCNSNPEWFQPKSAVSKEGQPQ